MTELSMYHTVGDTENNCSGGKLKTQLTEKNIDYKKKPREFTTVSKSS
jgi:hypothetical protein